MLKWLNESSRVEFNFFCASPLLQEASAQQQLAAASEQQQVQVQIMPDGQIHGKVIKYEICRSVLPEDQQQEQGDMSAD